MRAKATGQHEAEEGSRKPDDSHGLSWLATGFADRLTTSTDEPESDGLWGGFLVGSEELVDNFRSYELPTKELLTTATSTTSFAHFRGHWDSGYAALAKSVADERGH